MNKSFRKKLGKYAAVYDSSMESLGGGGGLEFVLTGVKGVCPKITKKQAETWAHNISVWAAMQAQRLGSIGAGK